MKPLIESQISSDFITIKGDSFEVSKLTAEQTLKYVRFFSKQNRLRYSQSNKMENILDMLEHRAYQLGIQEAFDEIPQTPVKDTRAQVKPFKVIQIAFSRASKEEQEQIINWLEMKRSLTGSPLG